MSAPTSHRWTQFSLKTLMAFIVVICLGLGVWHLLFTYGQYVEAEPAVVGQPIKVRGRFFHFDGKNYDGSCSIEYDEPNSTMIRLTTAEHLCFGYYWLEDEMHEIEHAGEFPLTLTPEGGRAIHGKILILPAE